MAVLYTEALLSYLTISVPNVFDYSPEQYGVEMNFDVPIPTNWMQTVYLGTLYAAMILVLALNFALYLLVRRAGRRQVLLSGLTSSYQFYVNSLRFYAV